jgi:glycosyltransferase involved in cell wall biosynthesis
MKLRPKSIGILSGNHLCRNPRVLKEASCLARAGFDVEVLGGWFHPRMQAEDVEIMVGAPFRFTPVVGARGGGVLADLRRLAARVLARGSRVALQAAGLQNRWQLGPVVGALGRLARARKFDLVLAHSEPALAVVADLQEIGRRVGVDMEDWFSQDLPLAGRRGRPVGLLSDLERRILRRGSYASCPSRSMSEALADTYNCEPPGVIYNAFPWADRSSIDGLLKDRGERRRPSIHWYSQTLGAGRGLEDLMAALPFVRFEVEVHLRGQSAEGFDAWLVKTIPEGWRDRIYLHGLVPNSELLSRIAEHDIGFAGEMRHPRNKELTVSNKILHYLLGGLAVVASDTAGQREIASGAPNAVLIYPAGDPAALADRINRLLGSDEYLRTARAAALAAAEARYCWERQGAHLVAAVEATVGFPGGVLA